MDINLLILIWIAGAVVGFYYSFRGAREAWGDLLVAPPDPAARETAANAFKSQVINGAIQLIWLVLGAVAVLSIAGPLIVWGLIITNLALAYKSREQYKSKRRVLSIILRRSQQKEK